MKITQYFINRPKLSNLILAIIFFAGISTMITLPRQDSPNISFDILTVSTFYPGASPEDVEINVTDPIEDELEEIDGISRLTSFSIENMSFLFVHVDSDSDDIPQVKEDIRTAVNRVSNLPPEVEDRPLIDEMKTTDFPILEIAITGDESQEGTLRNIARGMENELKSVGKVGKIQKIGYRKKEIQILADARKMNDKHVSFLDLLYAIRARNVKLSGGTLKSFVDEKNIVTYSEFEKPLDVKNVIIRSNFTGRHIKVSDIASVRKDYKERKIICRTNGINSINMIVKRRGTSDVINMSKKVDKIINKYKDAYKDQGIGVVKVVDYTYYTQNLLRIVSNNALIGFCLVSVCLFIFLNLHSAFWVALGIPISIFAAYIFFPMFDITINQISLITIIIVLGMLVDDAIVIAENINRHQENGMDFKEAAVVGTKEVIRPVLATIATTILCFVPIYFMKGVLGKFVVSIPTVIILTLGMSLFESTTLLPFHLSKRKRTSAEWKQQWIEKLRDKYANILKFFLRHRKSTIIGFVSLALITGLFFGAFSKFDLFPTEDFDLFYIVMEAKAGTSLEETFKKVKRIEEGVAKITPDLMMGYKTIVGDHRTDEAANSPALHENWALITVFLHPSAQRNKRSEKIIEELQEEFKDIKDFEKFVVREMKDGPPVGAPITVRLVSDDYKLCERYEKEILDFLKGVDGIYDIESSRRLGKKEIRLKLDYDFMARTGITAIDLADTIRVAYDGKVATTIRREGEEVDFRVRLKQDQRGDENILRDLQIVNKQGMLVKLKNFVTFDTGFASESIIHFNARKATIITGHVKTDIITSGEANSLIRDNFEKEIAAIPNISLLFGGHEKETQKSMKNFYMAFSLGIIGIYSILVLLLNSFIQPFLIMVAIPFGYIGVLIAFALHGLPMSFIGMIGSLGMIGVVVNDSLVMVTYLNSLKEKHNDINMDMIIEGARTRLRPVLLTTITTVFGLLPTVYGWGGWEPFVVPLVLAMSWGLIFATVITLILIPVLYSFLKKGFSHSVSEVSA